MNKNKRFLIVLWSFILCSFGLFQNFTQDLSQKDIHNDTCKHALQINESRIRNISSLHADLTLVWPKDAPSVQEPLNVLVLSLLDTNNEIYRLCLTDDGVRDSHGTALDELHKLANTESNPAWRRYVAVIELVLQGVKELSP